MWGSYDALTRAFATHTTLSASTVTFLSGGLAAQVFWLAAYPCDVIKQRIMTDPLGGALGDGTRRFASWSQAARAVAHEGGWRAFWRGFGPCFLRAFPANAVSLVVFEGVLRFLNEQKSAK